jgi:hypothetical protein
MQIECKIDSTMHSSLENLHKHIRKFKIKRADYYHEYYPRKDLLTGEPIEFKEYYQYFNQDFKNKNNLKKWLKLNKEEGEKWSKAWLTSRKYDKNLLYAPSYVELKSLTAPSMDYFNSIGGYYNITKELGFLDRYNNNKLIFKEFKDQIIIDSREQNPIKIENSVVSTLTTGDYGLKENDLGIYIERKSLQDFVSTLSGGLERFDKELGRAKEIGAYIIMIVESNINDSLSFNYLPQMKWAKANPSFVFKNLRDLLNKYPLNFQSVFVEGRKDFYNKMIKIFELENQAKTVDLQFKIENGEL